MRSHARRRRILFVISGSTPQDTRRSRPNGEVGTNKLWSKNDRQTQGLCDWKKVTEIIRPKKSVERKTGSITILQCSMGRKEKYRWY